MVMYVERDGIWSFRHGFGELKRQVGKLSGVPDKIDKRLCASQVFRWA